MSFTESPNLRNLVSCKKKACNMKLTRTFHPVGQGAFYTERFYDRDENNVFNMVYDCGTISKRQSLYTEITTSFQTDDEIDILFVSHFHEDHINGIDRLAKSHRIKKLVIPSLSNVGKDQIFVNYLYNIAISSDLNNFANQFMEFCYSENRNSKILNIDEITRIDNGKQLPFEDLMWEYIPLCVATGHQDFILKVINPLGLQEKYRLFTGNNFVIIRDFFDSNQKINKLKELYKSFIKQYNNNDNYYSMTVLSKPIIDVDSENKFQKAICLYTGDYPARDNTCRDQLKKYPYYQQFWNDIDIFQSPHHGSKYDNPLDLHDGTDWDCVICYGKSNRFSHPHKETLMNIALSKSMIHLVNEDQGSKYQTDFIF